MGLTLTPVFTDTFSVTANPLNPAHWSVFTGFSPLKAVAGSPSVCEATTTSAICAEYFNGGGIGNDQYVTTTLIAMNQAASLAEYDMYVRSSVDTLNCYSAVVAANGDGTATIAIELTLAGSVSSLAENDSLTYSLGDTFTLAVVGSSLYMLQNGVVKLTATDTHFSSGLTGVDSDIADHVTDIKFGNFVTGNASSGAYSVPDCRNYGIFPNSAVPTNGTNLYTGQTSSNPTVPGADSRTAGAPVASGTYPQNSRTPGTYGPGE
jgi:hypothetical protein